VALLPDTTQAKRDAFLLAFAATGTIRGAVKLLPNGTRLGRQTVYDWLERDPTFRESLQLAQDEYRESLQDIAMDRIREPQGNRGSDGLLSHMLNANWPEKYRQDAKPVDDAALVVARQTRDAIRELAKQELVARGELVEGKVVEAEEAEGKE